MFAPLKNLWKIFESSQKSKGKTTCKRKQMAILGFHLFRKSLQTTSVMKGIARSSRLIKVVIFFVSRTDFLCKILWTPYKESMRSTANIHLGECSVYITCTWLEEDIVKCITIRGANANQCANKKNLGKTLQLQTYLSWRYNRESVQDMQNLMSK